VVLPEFLLFRFLRSTNSAVGMVGNQVQVPHGGFDPVVPQQAGHGLD
jgi:hypothetical protein